MLALRQVNGVNFQVGHGPEILCKLKHVEIKLSTGFRTCHINLHKSQLGNFI